MKINYNKIKQEKTLSWAEKIVNNDKLHDKSQTCPNCGKRGKCRNGVGFEHQMRCGKCNQIWDPFDIHQELYYQEITAIIEAQGQHGDGI